MQDRDGNVHGNFRNVIERVIALFEPRRSNKGRAYYYEIVNVKRWILGSGGQSGNCEYCEEAADRGWVDDGEVYDSSFGDLDGPPAHPHCDCTLEYAEKRKRVYLDAIGRRIGRRRRT